MRSRIPALVVATLLTFGAMSPPAAGNGNGNGNGNVCAALDSGKIDTTKDPAFVHVEAPVGKLISGYCVKAGSANQGEGPVYVTFPEPLRSWDIRHPSGKDVSHYSLAFIDASTGDTGGGDTGGGDEPFDWNWTYPEPYCDALLVTYPADIPAGQANDVNIRIRWAGGETTLNYHNNDGTWSGANAFVYSQHPQWPAHVSAYEVVWIQVAGTNYHYGESFHNAPIAEPIRCRITSDNNPDTVDVPQAVSRVVGWRRAATIRRGGAVKRAEVVMVQPGVDRAMLQRRAGKKAWKPFVQVAVRNSRAKVAFPKERKVGTYRYRLVVPGTTLTTGTTTAAFRVKVRRR